MRHITSLLPTAAHWCRTNAVPAVDHVKVMLCTAKKKLYHNKDLATIQWSFITCACVHIDCCCL